MILQSLQIFNFLSRLSTKCRTGSRHVATCFIWIQDFASSIDEKVTKAKPREAPRKCFEWDESKRIELNSVQAWSCLLDGRTILRNYAIVFFHIHTTPLVTIWNGTTSVFKLSFDVLEYSDFIIYFWSKANLNMRRNNFVTIRRYCNKLFKLF